MPSIEVLNYIYAVIGVIVLVLLGVIFIYIIILLKKAVAMANKAEHAVENVENFIAKPLKVALQLVEQVNHVVGMIHPKTKRKSKHTDDDEA